MTIATTHTGGIPLQGLFIEFIELVIEDYMRRIVRRDLRECRHLNRDFHGHLFTCDE